MNGTNGAADGPENHSADHMLPNSEQTASLLTNGQAMAEPTEANGWNGTFVKAKDPYALMRDCNANSR